MEKKDKWVYVADATIWAKHQNDILKPTGKYYTALVLRADTGEIYNRGKLYGSSPAIIITVSYSGKWNVTSNKPLTEYRDDMPVYVKTDIGIAQASVAYTGSFHIVALITEYGKQLPTRYIIHTTTDLKTVEVTRELLDQPVVTVDVTKYKGSEHIPSTIPFELVLSEYSIITRPECHCELTHPVDRESRLRLEKFGHHYAILHKEFFTSQYWYLVGWLMTDDLELKTPDRNSTVQTVADLDYEQMYALMRSAFVDNEVLNRISDVEGEFKMLDERTASYVDGHFAQGSLKYDTNYEWLATEGQCATSMPIWLYPDDVLSVDGSVSPDICTLDSGGYNPNVGIRVLGKYEYKNTFAEKIQVILVFEDEEFHELTYRIKRNVNEKINETNDKLSELEGIRGNLEELVKSYDMDVISSILDDLNGTSDINGQLDELNS